MKSFPGAVILATNAHTVTVREEDDANMKGFMTGILLGMVAGAAADMALQTKAGKRTAAGKAMRKAVDMVDGAAASMQQNQGR